MFSLSDAYVMLTLFARLDLGKDEIEETAIAKETQEAVEMLNDLEASLDAV